MKRDFGAELQNYLLLKKLEYKRKKKAQSKEENKGSESDEDEEKEGQKKVHERGPLIDENVNVKICDLGNGCWTHFHFT